AEAKHTIDHGAKAARAECLAETCLEGADDARLFCHRTCAKRRADNPRPFQQQRGEVELAARSAHQADENEGATRRERGNVRSEIARSDGVEHDIDTAASGDFTNGGRKVGVAVVDGDVRAELEAPGALLLAP